MQHALLRGRRSWTKEELITMSREGQPTKVAFAEDEYGWVSVIDDSTRIAIVDNHPLEGDLQYLDVVQLKGRTIEKVKYRRWNSGVHLSCRLSPEGAELSCHRILEMCQNLDVLAFAFFPHRITIMYRGRLGALKTLMEPIAPSQDWEMVVLQGRRPLRGRK